MDKFIQELESEIKEEKLYKFIVANSYKFFTTIAVGLLFLAVFLWYQNSKLSQRQILGDKFFKAINLVEENKISDANKLLDEVINAEFKELSDLALYYKNSHLSNLPQETLNRLEKTNVQLIKELININNDYKNGKFEIIRLNKFEIDLLSDLAFNKLKDAREKLDIIDKENVIPQTIEQRVEAYRKILEIKEYESKNKNK